MQMKMISSFVAAFLATLFFELADSQSVCYSSSVYYVSVQRYATRSEAYTHYYYYSCGWWGRSRCRGSETRYRSTGYYYTGYSPRYRLDSYCCSGYSGTPSSGCTPICSQGCVHGSCTSPGYCNCNSGWTGTSCNIDINECASNNGGCNHNCTNTVSSYTCSCATEGYRLLNDQRTCQDIDECAEGLVSVGGTLPLGSGDEEEEVIMWCEQKCANTEGGYECDCLPGYGLEDNNITCSDINECDFINGNCDHTCHNTEGSFYCTCKDGFILLEDQLGCTDHDECLNNIHGCEQECHNTHGGYRCSCYDGYRLNGTTACEDIDECEDGLSGCSDQCTNYIGYFECSCDEGYEILDDNKTCIDINECYESNGDCDHICKNYPGTYKCHCNDGYSLDDVDGLSCIAQPCIPIVKPSNGNIQCTGLQVTNEICTFNCSLGYELLGSTSRTCQPDHTWTGEDVSCVPLKCPELAPPLNAFVSRPCNREFLSSCSVICAEGYHVTNETDDQLQWMQSCIYDSENGSVYWTEAKSCAETKICKSDSPPPCGLGVCLVDGRTFECDCEGTYHTGERCEKAFATISSIGTLTTEVPYEVSITTRLQKPKTITVQTSDSSKLKINGLHELTIHLNSDSSAPSSVNFTIVAHSPGSYTLSYRIEPSENFIQPEDSIILAITKDASGNNAIEYFDSAGVEEGFLAPGCCARRIRISSKSVCQLNTMIFKSSSCWSTELSTQGIVFVDVKLQQLPISIAGININNKLEMTLPESESQCSQCKSRCSKSSILVDAQLTQIFLSYDSLLRTFVDRVKHSFPSWLAVDIPLSLNKGYVAVYNFHSSLLTPAEILKLPGCELLLLDKSNTQKLYYTLRTQASLHVTFAASHGYYTTPNMSPPQCIILDICSGQQFTLHYLIPSTLQPSQLSDQQFFKNILTNNATLTFGSVALFLGDKGNEQSISETALYWNGIEYFQPQLSPFEFKISVSMDKIFTSNNNLAMRFQFSGFVFYKSSPEKMKVPGMLNGLLEVEVSTIINGQQESLHLLSSESAISLFSLPGNEESALSPGITFKLEYKNTSTEFFSSLLKPFDSSSKCTVNGFVSLDAYLVIKSLNLTSNCLAIAINRLQLPETLKYIYMHFPGSTSQNQEASIVIRSSTDQSSRITIGNFLQLVSKDSGAEVFEATYSSMQKVVGSFRDTNISVFDSEIYMQSLPLTGSLISFDGDTTIFKNFEVHVAGTASTESDINSMSLEVDLELDRNSQVKKNMTKLMNKHFNTEISSVLERRQNAESLFNTAKATYDTLFSRFHDVQRQRSVLAQKLNKINATVRNLRNQVGVANDAFKNAFDQHSAYESGSSLDDICIEQECEEICEEGVSCSTCYTTSSLGASGVCQFLTNRIRLVTRYRTVTVRSWRYELRCRRIGRILWFFFVPFFTFSRRCSRACVPYTAFRQEAYEAYESYVAIDSEPCVTRVFNEDVPSQCCMEYPCASKVRDFSCLLENDNCQRRRQEALEGADVAVRMAYQEYTQAQANLTLSLLELERIKTRYSTVNQEFKLVESALQSAMDSFEIRQQSKDNILDSTASFNALIIAYRQVGNDDNIIEIEHLHWHATLTSDTPVVMPVNLRFQYINQSSEILLVINLQNQLEAFYRYASTEVLEHILGPSSQSRRRKRQTFETSEINYLAETCAELENIEKFLAQLSSFLNKSVENFQLNNIKLKNLLSNNSFQYNSTNNSEFAQTLILSIIELEDEKALAVNSLSSLLQQNAFVEWQRSTEMLYSNGSEVNEIECVSFADCLQTALTNLESILEDTPEKGESIRQKLLFHRTEILDIAVSENYTFDDAKKSIAAFESILQDVNDVGYWCADPPVITESPPLELNISIGATLEIDCVVTSKLPVQYYWKRDSMLLSSTSSTLSIDSIQLSESGKYQCTAISDAGRISSLVTTVNVYYSPVLNQTLVSMMESYDGYDNGVNLGCDAHSWPPPGWKWLYRSSLDKEWSEVEGVDANVLTIEKVFLSDEGWYTCVAYNWLGNISSQPTFLRVLPAQTVSTKYLVTIEFELQATRDIQNILADMERLEQNIAEQIKELIPYSSIKLESIQILQSSSNETITTSFYIATPYFEYNSSVSTEDIIVNTANSLSQLEKSKNNLTAEATQPSSIQIEMEELVLKSIQLHVDPQFLSCADGYQVHSNQVICVGCNSGYKSGSVISRVFATNGQFIEQQLSQCTVCDFGEFQPEVAQSICIECPEYHSTTTTASSTIEDCIALCEPHTHSEDGFAPCDKCPPGYYQLDYGGNECLQCTNESSLVEKCITSSSTPTPIVTIQSDKPIDASIDKVSGIFVFPSESPTINDKVFKDESNAAHAAIAGSFSAIAIILIITVCIIIIVIILMRKWKKIDQIFVPVSIDLEEKKVPEEGDRSAETILDNVYESSGQD